MENSLIDNSTHAGIQHFVLKLREMVLDREENRGLVVGFGEGHEAEYLQCHTRTKIVGIDISSRIPKGKKLSFCPVLANAMNLPFKASTFNFVSYQHVIEHVQNPILTLIEINRILIPEGVLYIGTPNRHRILGYIGAYNTSLREKIRYNMGDLLKRLFGKFHNELGAHAGFSKEELEKMLIPHFIDLEWLIDDYLSFKYKNRLPNLLLNILRIPFILDVAAPSIYAICHKRSG